MFVIQVLPNLRQNDSPTLCRLLLMSGTLCRSSTISFFIPSATNFDFLLNCLSSKARKHDSESKIISRLDPRRTLLIVMTGKSCSLFNLLLNLLYCVIVIVPFSYRLTGSHSEQNGIFGLEEIWQHKCQPNPLTYSGNVDTEEAIRVPGVLLSCR